MLFCRWCHNLLLLERQQDSYRFVCRTCPFYYQVEGKMERKLFGLQKKQEADVLGGDKQWELVRTWYLCFEKLTHSFLCCCCCYVFG